MDCEQASLVRSFQLRTKRLGVLYLIPVELVVVDSVDGIGGSGRGWFVDKTGRYPECRYSLFWQLGSAAVVGL